MTASLKTPPSTPDVTVLPGRWPPAADERAEGLSRGRASGEKGSLRTALHAAAGVALALSAMGLAGCTEDTASTDQDQEEEVDSAQQAATATTVTIEASGPGGPVRDTFIYAQFPTYNYGTKTTIEVGKPTRYDGYNWGPDDRKQGLIRFDLSSIPAGSYIASATLSLRVSDVLPSHGAFFGAIYAYFVTDNAWVDTSLTWNTYGQKFQPGFSKPLSSVSQGSWATVDAKDFVSSWVSGLKPNFGLLLESSTVVDHVASFVSSEGPPGQRPKLEVTYYPSTCAPNPCQNGGSCSQTGNETYACTCKAGYSGTNCQNKNVCVPNPCKSGGACAVDNSKPEGYSCTCPAGTVGPNCQYNDVCAQVGQYVCPNGGTCNNVLPPGGSRPYTCTCANGFTGSNCQVPPPPPYCPCGDPTMSSTANAWNAAVRSPGLETKPASVSWYMSKCLPYGNIDVTPTRFWLTKPSFPGALTIFNTLDYVNRYYKNAGNYCEFVSGQYLSLAGQPGVVGVFDMELTDVQGSYALCMDARNGTSIGLTTPEDIAGCKQQIANAPHLTPQALPDLPLPIALGAPAVLALAEIVRRRLGKKVAS